VRGGSAGARPRSLAAALRRLLDDPAVRAGCARAARLAAADEQVDLGARVEALLGIAPDATLVLPARGI
jgi:UDP:flavonoid glycosyltransferase YjiC (YdhE family)